MLPSLDTDNLSWANAGIWDCLQMGSGQSMAYLCAPEEHRFIGRSAGIKTVVEADPKADQDHDVAIQVGTSFVHGCDQTEAGDDPEGSRRGKDPESAVRLRRPALIGIGTG